MWMKSGTWGALKLVGACTFLLAVKRYMHELHTRYMRFTGYESLISAVAQFKVSTRIVSQSASCLRLHGSCFYKYKQKPLPPQSINSPTLVTSRLVVVPLTACPLQKELDLPSPQVMGLFARVLRKFSQVTLSGIKCVLSCSALCY